MAVSPRVYVDYASLTVPEAAVVDAYTALTSGEKANVRNNLYLCAETQVELGNGYAEAGALIQAAFRGDIAEYYDYTEMQTMYAALSKPNQANFRNGIPLYDGSVGETSTAYGLLSAPDKATFQTNNDLYPETLAGCESLYGNLSAPDQASFQADESLYPETWQGASNLYAHLSDPNKTLFRADNYLFDLSASEIAAGFLLLDTQMATCVSTIQAGLSDYSGTPSPHALGLFVFKYEFTEAVYGYTDVMGVTMFLQSNNLYDNSLASCQTIYGGLDPTDQESFKTYYGLYSGGVTGITAGYNALLEGMGQFQKTQFLTNISSSLSAFVTYNGLSAPDKATFQTNTSLYPETLAGCEGLYDNLSAPDQASMITYVGGYPETLQGGKDLFDALVGTDQLLLTEYCYDELSAPNQVLFMEYIHVDPETLIGVIHGYSHLSASDQLSFMRSVLAQMNIRTSPEYYNLTYLD